MGAQPSRPGELYNQEKVVVHRFQTLNMDNDNESDYVEVSPNEKGQPIQLNRQPEGLAVHVLQSWQSKIMKDSKNRLALTALSSANPKEVLTAQPAQIADQQVYNIKIPFEGTPITNQRSSGRCWLFAATNVFRVALMKRHGLESFELSQAYLFYWDKLEKANWFLEQIIATSGEDLDSRLVQTLLGDIVSDGGQWDMVYNLVDKYGLVPQTLYPDSWNAKSSGALNSVVKTKLREFALKLRDTITSGEASNEGLVKLKAKMMQEITLILTLTLGPPPNPDESLSWQFVDKHGKAQDRTITPRSFAKNIYSHEFQITSEAIEGMISLVHDPRNETMNRLAVPRLGNIVGGRGINYVNVEMDVLKTACIKMLKSGMPIFFGSDVGKFSDNVTGIMDLDLIDYKLGFNTDLLTMTKAQRLMTGESQMTHAMVLTAVHIDEKTGKSVRWRVQNSWGEDKGDKGWFVMSDAWMDQFVYQAVVDPRFVDRQVREVLKKTPIDLPLWDPMGSLA